MKRAAGNSVAIGMIRMAPSAMPASASRAREHGGEPHDVAAAGRLGQHDSVRPRRDDRVEIGVGEAGVEGIDADIGRHPLAPFREKGSGLDARRRLCRLGDAVFQIEDHDVGAGARGARELPFAIGGNEEERAHQAGSAWRG